jgi:DNA adenine methylase
MPKSMGLSLDKTKPFLRWAGGKSWILKHLDGLYPKLIFNNYHEPFLGGASLFLYLQPQKRSYLSDLNSELIETYIAVRDEVEKVISELKKFKNNEDSYYKIRNSNFKSNYKRAARFIYLNQTSFNGIYRVNLNGKYNVPYGYRSKEFFNSEQLRAVSNNLKNSVLESKDFSLCISNVRKNDLVFLDPPYTITHNNNGFFKYNQKLFSEDDQYRLSEFIDQIKARKAFYILTNAAHDKVMSIFNKGDRIMEFKRASLIGGVNAKRGQYEELMITNIIK